MTTRLSKRRREEIEAALDHRFSDPQLLEEALTHASLVHTTAAGRAVRPRRSYQRLEFLGDRVLGLIVAHLLIDRYPEDAEGALTHRHVALVRKETLSEVAVAIGLDRWIQMAASEAEAGGRVKPAILADCCEALIAALYLDGGLEAARSFVVKHWSPRLQAMRNPPRDAKMALQEWAQARGVERPTYQVVATEGPAHAMTFTVEVALADQAPVIAAGRTKRAAERMAAGLMLERLQGTSDD